MTDDCRLRTAVADPNHIISVFQWVELQSSRTTPDGDMLKTWSNRVRVRCIRVLAAYHGIQHIVAYGTAIVYRFLADRTNGRAYATVLRPSSVVVCDVMYCG